MEPLGYIIIEDNRLDELALRLILSKYALLKYRATFRTLLEAESYLRNNEPDIIFADIKMPDGEGIDFAKTMHGLRPIIIFVTSHSEFAIDGFEISALDYLMKPVPEDRFAITYKHIVDYCEMNTLAQMQLEQTGKEIIVFKDGFNRVKLPVSEVYYLQAMQDYTKIITSDKSYLANNTLSVFLSENQHFNFIRIHRSYAILSRQIKMLKKDKVIGHNFELPIGKTYRAAIAKMKL